MLNELRFITMFGVQEIQLRPVIGNFFFARNSIHLSVSASVLAVVVDAVIAAVVFESIVPFCLRTDISVITLCVIFCKYVHFTYLL